MAKILVIGSYAPSLLNFRGPLLKTLIKEGHEVNAVAPEITDDIRRSLNKLGVSCQSIPMCRTGLNPLKDLKTFFSLRNLFFQARPEIIISYTIKPVIYGSLAARFTAVSHCCSMITGLGYTFNTENLKQRIIGWIARFLYRVALTNNEKVFFQNPDDQALFLRLHLVKEKGQAVLINGSGIDLHHYRVTPLPNEISFLVIARLIHEKGIYEYVEAARHVRSQYPQIRFQLVGWLEDSPTAIIESDLRSWQEEGVVEYMGKLDDVRSAIASSSVYVLPSYYREGTPRTILEAMAMGRPIITTDTPGCRETVIDGENGFLTPAKDVNALAERMEKFIKKPELIEQMGTKSRDIAEKKYDVHKVNRIIMSSMGLMNEVN